MFLRRFMPSPSRIARWVREARQRTLDLVADLTDEQLLGPILPIVNPLLWEIGHVAWFQEKWVLRQHAKQASSVPEVDEIYDSIEIGHDTRWDLKLPTREKTIEYITEVRDRALGYLEASGAGPDTCYLMLYTVFHEDMHDEAFTYTRQTLGYPAPRFSSASGREDSEDRPTGDAAVPGGAFMLGATPDGTFVFDNEKWAHRCEIEPFAIAKLAVTQGQFAAFVDDGGYRNREFWSDEGWRWREEEGAGHPVYWKRNGNRWLRRHFDSWVPLELNRAVIHVNFHEASAWCSWAKRRLPTECEWEIAAAGELDADGHSLSANKHHFPWNDGEPRPEHANLDWRAGGCVDVAAHPSGDSAFGCRQMLGNVWEWTSSDFLPYPGFEPDMYKEYSEPWFGTRKVLRGGCWATPSRLLRNTWRNYYEPWRRDVHAGFRTCALQE